MWIYINNNVKLFNSLGDCGLLKHISLNEGKFFYIIVHDKLVTGRNIQVRRLAASHNFLIIFLSTHRKLKLKSINTGLSE